MLSFEKNPTVISFSKTLLALPTHANKLQTKQLCNYKVDNTDTSVLLKFNSRLWPSFEKQLPHSCRDSFSSKSISQNLPNDRAHRFGLTTCKNPIKMTNLFSNCYGQKFCRAFRTFLTSRLNSRYSILSNIWLPFVSRPENFQSNTILSGDNAPLRPWYRLYSFWNTFIKFELNWLWSLREHPRCLRNGERRILVLLFSMQFGLPVRVVVFGIGFPWLSEHQQPAPFIHWTGA